MTVRPIILCILSLVLIVGYFDNPQFYHVVCLP